MGALLFMGMIGSIAYGSYTIKKEFEAISIDKKVQPKWYTTEDTIEKNFIEICKRSGIRLSKNNNPIVIKQCHKGMEYLQYQGFDERSVNLFKKVFQKRYNLDIEQNNTKIKNKHKKLLQKAQNNIKNTLVVFRREYYGNEHPQQRMNRLMQNELWNEIVSHYTYIRGTGTSSFCEVWTLNVPKDFFKDTIFDDDKNQLYKEICWIENIDDGSF